jgi:hypothetical protein
LLQSQRDKILLPTSRGHFVNLRIPRGVSDTDEITNFARYEQSGGNQLECEISKSIKKRVLTGRSN